MADNLTTRTAIESAASTATFSRTNGTRQGQCDWLNSHRDGPCQRCQDRDRHDAEVAAQAAPAPALTSRQVKAIALIEAGAVTLNLDGTATVRGSGRATYTVTRADGVTTCTCPDHARRGVECKHLISVRALCAVYRACQREARATGRTRLPANLARALPTGRVATKVTIADIVADLTPAGALVDDRGVPYCHDCGRDLVDGRCPGRDWVERVAA